MKMMRIELNDRKKGIDDKFDKHENEMKAMQFDLTHTVSEAHATSKKLAEDEQMDSGNGSKPGTEDGRYHIQKQIFVRTYGSV